VLGQAGDDGPDLRGIADKGDDGYRVSTPGTAQRSDIVNHGQKTRPCLPAVARAYSLNLSGFPAGGIKTVAAQQLPAAGGECGAFVGR